MAYIDGFVMAVPTANQQNFIARAKLGVSLDFFIVYRLSARHRRAALARTSAALRQGFLTHLVVHAYVRDHAVAAHEHVERRVGGKAVLCLV